MQPVRAPGPVPGGHGAEPTRRSAGVHPAQPLGVVAAITPWNFPAVAPVRKLGPALIAGNGVVLKPAPENSLTALALGALLREAGLPEGELSIVTGDGERVGAALVTTTASQESRSPAPLAWDGPSHSISGRLGRVQLELGGKNAAYVHSARDLSKVAEHITAAAIQASGQRCTAISRVIVHEEVADELVGLLTEAYSSYKVDSGWGRTAWWARWSARHSTHALRDTWTRGSRRAPSGRRPSERFPRASTTPPPSSTGSPPHGRGPRGDLRARHLRPSRRQRRGRASAGERLRLWLGRGGLHRGPGNAMRFIEEAEAAMVHVNQGTISQPHAPFGGMKESGVGEFSIGYTTTDFFTQTKSVYLAGRVT